MKIIFSYTLFYIIMLNIFKCSSKKLKEFYSGDLSTCSVHHIILVSGVQSSDLTFVYSVVTTLSLTQTVKVSCHCANSPQYYRFYSPAPLSPIPLVSLPSSSHQSVLCVCESLSTLHIYIL